MTKSKEKRSKDERVASSLKTVTQTPKHHQENPVEKRWKEKKRTPPPTPTPKSFMLS